MSPNSTFLPYGLWLTKLFRDYEVLGETSKGVSSRDIMSDGVLSKMELCLMGGELLKKDILGFQPKEAYVGCLKMQKQVANVKALQQLLVSERARDRVWTTTSLNHEPPRHGHHLTFRSLISFYYLVITFGFCFFIRTISQTDFLVIYFGCSLYIFEDNCELVYM